MARRPLRVLMTGASTRAAAASAARAGFQVTALDAFGDLDQQAGVHALSLPRDLGQPFTAGAAARSARTFACDAVVYLSPLENHPRAVHMLARGRQLWGNSPGVLARVRDPVLVADAIRRHGLTALAVSAVEPPPDDDVHGWLIKPRASGGGHGIRAWSTGMRLPRTSYLQERVDGLPASIVFVAAGRRALPLGVSRQIVGDAAFGSAGYRYCGSILGGARDPHWGPKSPVAARALAVAQALTSAFDLVGINGVDVMIRDGIPLAVEVNPRWCSSVELVDRAFGVSAFSAHMTACTSGELALNDAAAAPSAFGKAVVFARHGIRVGDTRGWCHDPSLGDVPPPGAAVNTGQPVCTVFATGHDVPACYGELVARAARVYGELRAWSVSEKAPRSWKLEARS